MRNTGKQPIGKGEEVAAIHKALTGMSSIRLAYRPDVLMVRRAASLHGAHRAGTSPLLRNRSDSGCVKETTCNGNSGLCVHIFFSE